MYLLPVYFLFFSIFFSIFFSRWLGKFYFSIFNIFSIFLSLIFSFYIFYEVVYLGLNCEIFLAKWFQLYSLNFHFYFDTLSAIMLVLVLFISFFVQIFSLEYIWSDPSFIRFVLYINIFTFFMLIMVLSSNLIQFFLGWEGIGLASYLLINFWYFRPEANRSAVKAVLMNRLGDFALYVAIICFLIYFTRNNFFCIETLHPNKHIEKFYVLSKTEYENIAKMIFAECLAALNIHLNELHYDEPFYAKCFFGKNDFLILNDYIDYLKQDSRTTEVILRFLVYLQNPSYQTKENYEEFRELFGPFLKDYIFNYGKEWHPLGLKNEINFLKKTMTKESVCILAVEEYALRIKKIENLLKFFIFWESDGIYYIRYSALGEERLNRFFTLLLAENLNDFYKKQFSIIDKNRGSAIYKLKNIIPHINKIQWFFIEFYKNNYTYYNPLNNDFGDYPNSSIVFNQSNTCLAEAYTIYLELAEEKKLIQELCYILYYAKIVDGSAVMIDMFKQAKNLFIYFKPAMPSDHIQNRVFTKFGKFVLKSGIINNELEFNNYLNSIKKFYSIKIHYNEDYTHLSHSEFLNLINDLEDLLKKIKKIDSTLADRYLPTISKIRESRRFTKN